jgi:hypothetical protein
MLAIGVTMLLTTGPAGRSGSRPARRAAAVALSSVVRPGPRAIAMATGLAGAGACSITSARCVKRLYRPVHAGSVFVMVVWTPARAGVQRNTSTVSASAASTRRNLRDRRLGSSYLMIRGCTWTRSCYLDRRLEINSEIDFASLKGPARVAKLPPPPPNGMAPTSRAMSVKGDQSRRRAPQPVADPQTHKRPMRRGIRQSMVAPRGPAGQARSVRHNGRTVTRASGPCLTPHHTQGIFEGRPTSKRTGQRAVSRLEGLRQIEAGTRGLPLTVVTADLD